MTTDNADRGGLDSAALMDEACARNTPLELHFDLPNGENIVTKSRFIGGDVELMFLDNPQSIGQPFTPSVRQSFVAHFTLGGTRYTFSAAIRELDRMVQLNQQRRVIGIAITKPKSLESGQRRAHFRISLNGLDSISCDVHLASPEEDSTAPIDAGCMKCKLINLSLAGGAMVTDVEMARAIRVGDRLFLHFLLPGDEEEYVFLTKIRQLMDIADNTAIRIGLQFRPWPDMIHLRRIQQRLQKFITAAQRNQLKKKSA